MADTATAIIGTPAWVDLATTNPRPPARSTRGCSAGTSISPDPQYGGYGIAKVGDQDAAGIGGPDQPAAWSLYVGSDDLEALAQKVRRRRRRRAAVRCRRPGPMAVFTDARPAPSSRRGRAHRWAASDDGPNVRLGRAERPRCGCRRAVLHRGLRLDGEGRRARPAVHRVPGRRPQHRRGDRDVADGAGRGAELLARLLRRRRRRCDPSSRGRHRRRRAGRAVDFPAAGCRSSAIRRARPSASCGSSPADHVCSMSTADRSTPSQVATASRARSMAEARRLDRWEPRQLDDVDRAAVAGVGDPVERPPCLATMRRPAIHAASARRSSSRPRPSMS